MTRCCSPTIAACRRRVMLMVGPGGKHLTSWTAQGGGAPDPTPCWADGSACEGTSGAAGVI